MPAQLLTIDLLSRYWSEFFMPFTWLMLCIGLSYLLTLRSLKSKKTGSAAKAKKPSIDSQVLDVYSRTI